MQTSEFAMPVMVQTRLTMDQQLTEAEEIARSKAREHGSKSIMVTRHSPQLFTVALSAEAPFGLTVEQHSSDAGDGVKGVGNLYGALNNYMAAPAGGAENV